MAVPTATQGASWPDVAIWLLEHNGPTYALVAAIGLVLLWKADMIITAVGSVVNAWRDTNLRISEFEARKTDRISAIAQDLRDEQVRLHISTGESR